MAIHHRDLHADPSLVETWVTGWTLSRETKPPVVAAGGYRVDVGLPQHQARYVFPHCSDHVTALAGQIHDPWIFLKVCAPPHRVQDRLPPRWQIQKLGFMMTHPSSPTRENMPLPPGYSLELVETPTVLVARVKDGAGESAASGRVALHNGFAIYDRIETQAEHRRRGLGTLVMNSLQRAASRCGVERGILVATADGRALYETLGWQLHCLYTTAVIPEPPI